MICQLPDNPERVSGWSPGGGGGMSAGEAIYLVVGIFLGWVSMAIIIVVIM